MIIMGQDKDRSTPPVQVVTGVITSLLIASIPAAALATTRSIIATAFRNTMHCRRSSSTCLLQRLRLTEAQVSAMPLLTGDIDRCTVAQSLSKYRTHRPERAGSQEDLHQSGHILRDELLVQAAAFSDCM